MTPPAPRSPKSAARRETPSLVSLPAAGSLASEWLSLAALAMAFLALLLVLTVGLGAQPQEAGEQPQPAQPQADQTQPAQPQQPLPDFSDPAWRERALAAHRARVSALLAERRAERERAEQREREQAEQRQQQAPSGETPPAAPEPAFRGTVELISDPVNVFATAGEPFVSSVKMRNVAGEEIDHVRVCLEYDPLVLRPLRVSDRALRPHLAAPARMESDPVTGRVIYEAALEPPLGGFSQELLTIEWEPLVMTPRTDIALAVGRPDASALTHGERDVLGELGVPDDGTVGSAVTVRPRRDLDARGALFIDSPDTQRTIQGLALERQIGLRLVADRDAVAADEVMAVDLQLLNPGEMPIDDVEVTLRYDPRVFEVLDAAPGENRRPGENWIVGGVNLHDAPFHRAYPFDFHLLNEAHNDVGLAFYHMGLSQVRPLPSGTFARIYLRALTPARRTALSFEFSDDPTRPTTAVRCAGVDLLNLRASQQTGAASLELRVFPRTAVTAAPRGRASPRG